MRRMKKGGLVKVGGAVTYTPIQHADLITSASQYAGDAGVLLFLLAAVLVGVAGWWRCYFEQMCEARRDG